MRSCPLIKRCELFNTSSPVTAHHHRVHRGFGTWADYLNPNKRLDRLLPLEDYIPQLQGRKGDYMYKNQPSTNLQVAFHASKASTLRRASDQMCSVRHSGATVSRSMQVLRCANGISIPQTNLVMPGFLAYSDRGMPHRNPGPGIVLRNRQVAVYFQDGARDGCLTWRLRHCPKARDDLPVVLDGS